ncbi:hypothetical protein [Variovorax sp. JS1663]|uniref:hypothetical protein n=1 Tax=Variovorax sp. JS1663 TaxID=1851577 RepID=UPI000B349F7C|nr:hypothetical protein [Variovorax sp. JS1663]OUM02731.1 hypothetical protein A8M77_08980 [Variovorax sp. JS1663]
MSTDSPQRKDDEPEIGFEESIPLDGRDPVGEKMIEDLGRDGEHPGKVPPSPPAEPMPEQLPVS